jgi:hypothetical protein
MWGLNTSVGGSTVLAVLYSITLHDTDLLKNTKHVLHVVHTNSTDFLCSVLLLT